MARITDRTDLWLSLLRRLNDEFPSWAVWKNTDSAMAGKGDVDSLAPPESWPGIRETFRSWAAARGYSPMIVCRHVPQGPHFVTFEPASDYFVHLDVKVRATFRGSTLVDAWSLPSLTEVDPRGFRRVRPGVDGVIRLCSNGIRRGGRANPQALVEKSVLQLLAADPEGVEAMAARFGPARNALLTGVRAVLDGGWDRRAMLTVEAWALARSVTEPRTALGRLWVGALSRRRCPVLRVIIRHDRRVPEDFETWLAAVHPTHEVFDPTASDGPGT